MELIEGGAGVPPEPDWATVFPGRSKSVAEDRERASEYWQCAIEELRRTEKLAITNGHAIYRLVMAYVLWDRAAAQVMRKGAIIPAPKTKSPMHNPWATAMAHAGKMACVIETELTLTPRHRDAGGKVPRPRGTTAANVYLRRVDKDERPKK